MSEITINIIELKVLVHEYPTKLETFLIESKKKITLTPMQFVSLNYFGLGIDITKYVKVKKVYRIFHDEGDMAKNLRHGVLYSRESYLLIKSAELKKLEQFAKQYNIPESSDFNKNVLINRSIQVKQFT